MSRPDFVTPSVAARWVAVVVFATAMAWVEAAVVFDLRTLVGRIDPHQAPPLPPAPRVGEVELIRELATLIMLAAVGWLAGRRARERLGFGLIAFGVWDIFYYLFLRPITGWPRSWSNWDVLFLLPLPWWGPVWAPVSVAALMIGWGTLVTLGERPGDPLRLDGRVSALAVVGGGLALYVFMADALRVAPQGPEALRHLMPTRFNWPLFSLAWLLMALPVWDLARQLLGRRRLPLAASESA